MTRSPASHTRKRTRTSRLNSFRPLLQTLEDRVVPTGAGWAIDADPEGFVYHDVNGNGVFDAGESAMGAGLTVYVDANNNSAFDAGEINTTTDATGHYSIILPDGTYTIRVIAPSGFQDDSRPFGTLVREYASVESGANGNYSGLAWVNDSLYQTFKTSQRMYQIDPETGAALGSAVTIPSNIFGITFDGTDFWGASPANPTGSLVRFNFAGQELQRFNFAGVAPNSVAWDGSVLWMVDNSAKRIDRVNPADGTIVGYVNAPNEQLDGLAFDGTSLWVNGTTTDRVYALDPTTGAVQRSFAAPGDLGLGLAIHGSSLWLSDNLASRVFQYDLGYGGGRIVTVAGSDVTGVNLAVFQPGSISGRVFNDDNQNGLQDAVDGGLAGWRVYLDSTANGQYDRWEASAVTDALGNYTMSGLRPGSYTVALDLAAQRLTRWSRVAPAGGSYSVTLNSGDAISGENFANFLDRSNPQPTEWGDFEGGRMNLYTGLAWVDETVVTSTPTNSNFMTYSVAADSVANSTYAGFSDWRLPNLTEAQQAAINDARDAQFLYGVYGANYLWWTSTAKGAYQWAAYLNSSTGSAYVTTRTSGLLTAMFRDPATYIDDGGTGYSATGFTGKNTSAAYQGDQSTAASGTGSKTATWTFGGLEVGATYKVSVTWKNVSGAASNSPFKVIDGTSTVATVAVNQQVAPSDYSIADIGWKGLGTFTIASNTLKVQLSNLANGTVIADAVRIFRVFPSYAPAPLVAAGLPLGAPASATIASSDLQPLVTEALRRWQSAGVDVSGLDDLSVGIADLGGRTLGLASGHTITLDDNAAGWGWFVDPTPGDDSEFTTLGNQGERNRMDLLTVLEHEIGHALGYEHEESGVMIDTLSAGTRRLAGSDVNLSDFTNIDWLGAPEWLLPADQRKK